MDIELAPADAAFRDEVREFLRLNLPDWLKIGTELTPSVFVEPDIGQEWTSILSAKGWLGYHWPVEHGGTGWTPIQRYIFEKESALAGAPSLPVMGLKLVAPVIWAFGTDAQKAYYLPRVLSGEDYWCQGFSEPGSGSDLASLQCKAVRKGDEYIVNGTKLWTTHAHHANRIFCLVRTDNSGRKQAGISFLLIDMDTPGLNVRPIKSMAGDHEVNQVFFEDVRVPVENLVGAEGQGWQIAKFLLENERGGSCHAPRLSFDLDQIVRLSRTQSDGRGGLLSDDPQWQKRVAVNRLAVDALEMIELKFLADMAKGHKPASQASLAKMLASSLRQDIDLLAMDLHDFAGLQLESARPFYGANAPAPVGSSEAQVAAARYLNSRAWTIFGGSNEVQANILASAALGL
jgi:alkylation response protein AidB-like acyl-CoA dehydrogenase